MWVFGLTKYSAPHAALTNVRFVGRWGIGRTIIELSYKIKYTIKCISE